MMPTATFRQLPQLRAQRRRQGASLRDQHPDVLRFLEHHLPWEYERVMRCDAGGRIWRDESAGDRWKVTPLACHRIPWCVQCTRQRHFQRLFKALDHFDRCTPAGEGPRYLHIVQTAPVTDDGKGWGKYASNDVPGFTKLVWQVTQECMGDGLGAVMSYQDFGEQGFAKRHPHIDYTVNGWRVGDDGPEKVAWPFEAGKSEWVEATNARATKYDLQAGRFSVNVHANRIATGRAAYWKGLAYQLRELVDVRKMRYDRDRRVVYWMSYKANERTKFTIKEFLAGLREYQARLGPWVGKGSQRLHREVGHLSNRSIRKTQREMGGESRAHRENCTCKDCGDWRLEFIDME